MCGAQPSLQSPLESFPSHGPCRAQMLALRAGSKEQDVAFLAGLLHDVGQMVLLHGDPRGFEALGR